MLIRCQSVEQEDETINNLGVDSCFLESCRKNFCCMQLQIPLAAQFKTLTPEKKMKGVNIIAERNVKVLD